MKPKRIALVTGAYKGLGLAWSKQLTAAGYQVILSARRLEQAEQAAKQIPTHASCVFPKALDVVQEDQLRALVAWTEETFGKIDLIVNNAGVNPKDYTDKSRMAKTFFLDDLDAEEVLAVMKINSLGPLLVAKHFRSLLNKSDHPVILQISSWLGSVSQLSFGGHYGYAGSKNLLNMLNKSMAWELKSDRIIAVCVNPGWVQTDMGGKKGEFTAEESVAKVMRNVLAKVSLEDSGKFFHHDGQEHPW